MEGTRNIVAGPNDVNVARWILGDTRMNGESGIGGDVLKGDDSRSVRLDDKSDEDGDRMAYPRNSQLAHRVHDPRNLAFKQALQAVRSKVEPCVKHGRAGTDAVTAQMFVPSLRGAVTEHTKTF